MTEITEPTYTIRILKESPHSCRPSIYKAEVTYLINQNNIKIHQKRESPIKITRSNIDNTFLIKDLNKSRCRNSSIYLGPLLWNYLPTDLRNDSWTKEDFKNEIILLLKLGYFNKIYNTELIK